MAKSLLCFAALALLLAACGPAEREVERQSFAQLVFSDINGHWAESFIEVLAQEGVIAGYPDGTFKPNQTVTRAEFAALIKAAFKPAPVRPGISFPDVPPSHWAHGAVDAVVRGGFMAGYPSGVFLPENKVKRIEVMATLESGLKLPPKTQHVLDFYIDAKAIPDWGRAAAASATHHGLVASHPVPYLMRPAAAATRADVAVAVHQAMVVQGELAAVASNYLVGAHLVPGIAEYHRTEHFGFGADSKHVWLVQSYVDGGAGIPVAHGTLKNIKSSACVPGGCVKTALTESATNVYRADAVKEVLTKTWTLRKALGLTPLQAGKTLPEAGRTADTVFFRVDERNATLTVRLKQQAKTCHDSQVGYDYPCAAYELEVDDGHYLEVLGSLSTYHPWAYSFRVKGAVLAPDSHAVAILVEAHWQGFECVLVYTMLETLENPFAH
jgi:hypothetical protein